MVPDPKNHCTYILNGTQKMFCSLERNYFLKIKILFLTAFDLFKCRPNNRDYSFQAHLFVSYQLIQSVKYRAKTHCRKGDFKHLRKMILDFFIYNLDTDIYQGTDLYTLDLTTFNQSKCLNY